MAHNKGNSPVSTDYNSFIGTTGVTSAYASSVAATQKVAALLGVGFGDRGYGQSSPLLTAVSQGGQIKATDWINLRTAIANIAGYQGTATTLLPPASEYVAGQKIVAEVIATTAYDIPTMITNIDTNRLVASAGNLSVTSNSLTVTRATTWGTGSTGIVAEITATFASEDAARFFFNSGGAVNLVLAHPSSATTQDSNWNTILSALGTVSVGARATTRSGSGGTPLAVGYYNLTAAYQTVFNGTGIGTGAYTANNVTIDALATGIVGTNGGNGTAVKIRITLTDGHTNAFSDSVALGTNAVFGFKKAALILTGIASPSFATVTNF
jgi:hypothetical protein